MPEFIKKWWHTEYPDILVAVVTVIDIAIEVTPLHDVAAVLGITEDDVRTALHDLVVAESHELPDGKQVQDRWFDVGGTDVIVLSDLYLLVK